MSTRLSTGVPILDRQLGGGLPPGSLVAVTMPPESQGELLLTRLIAVRETLYVTTIRPEDEVRDAIATRGGVVHPVRASYREILEKPEPTLSRMPEQGNLIVDTIDELERGTHDPYLRFLNMLKAQLASARGVGLVRCLDGNDSPNRRLTLDRADVVWQLRFGLEKGRIVSRLYVSKFRSGRALTEPIKLEFTDDVTIDTSRDIG